jgi:hypothetical protein
MATRLFLAYSLIEYQKYSKYIKLIILIIGFGFGYKALTGSNNEIHFSILNAKSKIVYSVFGV